MDTPLPLPGSSNYEGLKDELQKIAGIIEQYPDDLKQRAFELLIAAYLGGKANGGSGATAPESQEAGSAPVETSAGEAAEAPASAVEEIQVAAEYVTPEIAEEQSRVESGEADAPVAQAAPIARPLAPVPPIKAGSDPLANDILRKKIRLRPMTEMPWRQPR
jgi:hypothetical protein